MKKLGLTLGGGGAKGLAHIAFLKVLDELYIKPSVISGTSIGAIIGAFYASGLSGAKLHEKLSEIGLIGLLKFINLSGFRKSGLFSGKGIEKFLKDNLPVTRFEDLKIPLRIVATDFWERKEVVFSKGNLITAIRASISMPGVFSPAVINDRIMIDGSAVNPLPFDLLEKDSDFIVAIDVSGEKTPDEDTRLPGTIGTVFNTFQIMQSAIVSEKIARVPPDIYIKPRLENFRVLEFDKYQEIIGSVAGDTSILRSELIKKFIIER